MRVIFIFPLLLFSYVCSLLHIIVCDRSMLIFLVEGLGYEPYFLRFVPACTYACGEGSLSLDTTILFHRSVRVYGYLTEYLMMFQVLGEEDRFMWVVIVIDGREVTHVLEGDVTQKKTGACNGSAMPFGCVSLRPQVKTRPSLSPLLSWQNSACVAGENLNQYRRGNTSWPLACKEESICWIRWTVHIFVSALRQRKSTAFTSSALLNS